MKPGIPTHTILWFAGRREGFSVTWRDRDATLMSRCNRLVREGKLTRGRREPGGGSTTYHRANPPEAPIAVCDSASSATADA